MLKRGVVLMMSDHEIGRVVAVDTAQVTIELNRDLKALTKSTYENTLEIGRINSYVVIPVGARRIVAMITRVVLTEDSELKADKTMVSLPSSRRLMKATMIGTIDEGAFKQGISLFPVLDSPVLITTKGDLDTIFGVALKQHGTDPNEPIFCIPIGRSAVFPDYNVRIDPDAFFGKHAAVIGSTGSGKSCSIATIIQSILNQDEVQQTRFIVLDTNGEYRAAFQNSDNSGSWTDANPKFKTLYIPTNSRDSQKLTIPYWFMNSDDFGHLFRASPGVQKPVLIHALSLARDSINDLQSWLQVRTTIIKDCNSILGLCSVSDKSNPRTIRQLCDGLVGYIEDPKIKQNFDTINTLYPGLTAAYVEEQFKSIRNIVREGIRKEGEEFESYAAIDADKRRRIEEIIHPLIGTISRQPTDSAFLGTPSADSPRFFSKTAFRYTYLEHAITRDEASSSRARDNCSTMLMRIYRLLEDSRFEFLFGPQNQEWPSVIHSLATFLRDILGAGHYSEKELTDPEECGEGLLPFYDRHRNGAKRSNVVIIDLSLLASEVLENVTALIGRLIHEFLQRISDPVSGVERGEYPVVLILEEAQNYIREGNKTEGNISREVFERIAREGRKYGLGLVVASQRPSELSKTVLSQCNSFIVHRLQNPEDLRYFREIVPGIHSQLLDQLPALAPKSALVLGECVQAPVLVDMREANPTPRSKNPKFYKSWVEDEKHPDFETVCEKWEGKPPSQQPTSEQPEEA